MIPCKPISSSPSTRHYLCIGIENPYRTGECDPLNYNCDLGRMINTTRRLLHYSSCSNLSDPICPTPAVHWNWKIQSTRRMWSTQLWYLQIEDDQYNTHIILWFHASQFLREDASDTARALESKILIESENVVHSTALLANWTWSTQYPYHILIPRRPISSDPRIWHYLCVEIGNPYRIRERDALNYNRGHRAMINTTPISFDDSIHVNLFKHIYQTPAIAVESKIPIESGNAKHSTPSVRNGQWLIQYVGLLTILPAPFYSNASPWTNLCIGIENSKRIGECDPLDYDTCQLNMINTIPVSYCDSMQANFFEYMPLIPSEHLNRKSL